MPEKAIICSLKLSPHFLCLVKIIKVAILTTDLSPSQKMPYIYLAEWKGIRVLIVDTFVQPEDKYLECFPILYIRALVISGVEKFFLFSEATAMDKSLQVGTPFLLDNYMPMNSINPFIGPHIKEY